MPIQSFNALITPVSAYSISNTRDNLNNRVYSYYFWLFTLIHTLIWTLGPALLRPTLPHDTLESITWGLQWQLGYNKHPFLAAWLSAGVTALAGIGWPVYLLAQMAVSTTFIAVWKLAQHLLPLLHALIATLALEGVFFYNINSFNFTPDTLQSPLWALVSLFFYQAVTQQHLRHWLYTGLFAALCLCTKYQSALMLIPMGLFCLFEPMARQSFKRPGIYCALALMCLLITPHLLWLIQHHFITLTYAAHISTEYTADKTLLDHLMHPLGFFINNFLAMSGVFIVLWPFYYQRPSSLQLAPFTWHFLIGIGLSPLMLSLLLCVITGDYFPPRWSTPYFWAVGILIMGYLRPVLSKKQVHQFGITLVLFSSLLFLSRMSTFTVLQRPSSDAFLPNQQIAHSLSTLWHDKYPSPLPFLAGSHYLVTGVLPYMTDKPTPYLSWDPQDSAWVDEQEVLQKGGLFIWDKEGYYTWDKASRNHTDISSSVLKRFPNLKKMPDYLFYRLSDHQPIIIGVAILPPQNRTN